MLSVGNKLTTRNQWHHHGTISMKTVVSIWGLPSLCPSDPNEETLEQEAAGWEQGQSECKMEAAARSRDHLIVSGAWQMSNVRGNIL